MYNNLIPINCKQKEFIESPLEDSKLLGIPGGGKTTIIICKIFKHLEKKELSINEFLVTSFSKKACSDFILKGSELEIKLNGKTNSLFNSGNVKTLHSIAGTIIYTMLGKQCSSVQVSIISAINLIKTHDDIELLKIKCLKNLKIIFVDEAQDLSDIQYELIILLKNKLKINLVLIGDPNQSIYQFQNGSEKYLIEYEAKKYYLEENNRSTQEITNFLNYFRPWNSKLPPMKSARVLKSVASTIRSTKHNSIPEVFTGSQDEICIRILNEIKKSKIALENIAIIGPVKKSDKKNNYVSVKFGLQRIANMFEKNNVKFIKHYNDNTGDDDILNTHIEQKKGYVNLYTIHGSKGLEFEKVIIINFHFKTFGKVPTLQEYNNFKYLWYVALSRAKDELLICCDNDKLCWNELLNCPSKHYEIIGDDPNLKEPNYNNIINPELRVSKIIYDKRIFNESVLLKFYKNINFSEEQQQMYIINKKYFDNHFNENKLFTNNNYLILDFLKAIFQYYYGIFHFSEINFINKIKEFVSNTIYVNNKYKQHFTSFCEKNDLDIMDTIDKPTLIKNKNKLNKNEKKILEHILNKVEHTNKKFSLVLENEDIFMESKTILKICDNVFDYENEKKLHWNIFKLCLFKYQYENEAKYLWTNKSKMKIFIDLLQYHIKQIKLIAPRMNFKFTFDKKCIHPNLKLFGNVDLIMDNSCLVIFKFSDVVDITEKIKIFLLYHCHHNTNKKWSDTMKVEIWNFKTGIRHILKFDPLKTNLYFTCQIATLCKTKLHNMIFVYDLETTGLDKFKCEIIERYIHELTHDVGFSFGIIKARHKVPKEITQLTGITQKEINQGQDINIFKNEIKTMLEICEKPIFIAHNGNVFDHQILKINNIIDSNCKLLDSRIIIRQLSKNKIGNESLSDTYKIICGQNYKGFAHRAKADVIMILDIFEKINVNVSDILKMC